MIHSSSICTGITTDAQYSHSAPSAILFLIDIPHRQMRLSKHNQVQGVLQLSPSRGVHNLDPYVTAPERAFRIRILLNSVVRVAGGIPGSQWRHVMGINNLRGMSEIFTVAVCVFKHGLTSADCNIIDSAQVGCQFCKPHCSIMWHARHRILQRHEHHGLGGESLVSPTVMGHLCKVQLTKHSFTLPRRTASI